MACSPAGLGAHYGAERLGCTVIPMSGGMTERQVQLIDDFRPDIIMVTPSYMLAILDEFEREGLDPRACSLQLGIFGAEPWTDAMRARDRAARSTCTRVDLYGLSEVIGPGVACECVETKDGPHLWEDHFYPEIIDPGDRRAGCPTASRASWSYLADQGGDAGHPLPHPRPHAPAAGHRAHDAADREDHRAAPTT